MDMFSLLPEIVLITIVSFLPFDDAARTSVLAKKWLKIWKSTRNIEFNEFFFVDYDLESAETIEAQRKVFLNFITNFMNNYKANNKVDKFSLTVTNPETCADIVERCIAFATERGVKELRLDFSGPTWDQDDDVHDDYDALFQLPNHVYSHSSLEALELYACGFSMPDLCNLVELKDVSFGWIQVKIETVKTLLSTFKKLENLSLVKCWNLEHFDMRTQEVGLKRLILHRCHFLNSDYVDLVAPNLKYLEYSGEMGVLSVEVPPNVMQEAHLDFTPTPHYDECGIELCDLLRDLSSVSILTVCSFLLQVIPFGEEPVEDIRCDNMNVRHLILKTNMRNQEMFGFMFLLRSVPFLEKITVDLEQGVIYGDFIPKMSDHRTFAKFWEDNTEIFECLRSSLKVVEVNGFRMKRNHGLLCQYFIQRGRVLEQLVVTVIKKEGIDERLDQRYASANSLLSFPRASHNLQISII